MRQIYFYGVLLSLWIVTVSGVAEPNNAHQQPNQLNNRPIADPEIQWCWHRNLARIHFNLIKPGGENDLKNDNLENGTKKYKYKEDYEPANAPSKLAVYGSIDPKDCELVFAFKGTDKGIDVLHDLDFVPKEKELYHAGFKQAAEKYAEKVLEKINELPAECTAPKITFTGHSLGGAIAYLIANANLNEGLRKKLESFRRPKTELVLFGTPRVARGSITQVETLLNKSGLTSLPIDLSKTTHYYIEKDPVPVLPPNPPFQDLTDNNFKLETIPVNEQVPNAGTQGIQNHLPLNYLKRMDEACEGKSVLSKTPQFNYNSSGSLQDILSRYSRAARDKVIENAQVVKDKVIETAQLANEVGKTVIAKGKEGLETARVGIPAALAPRDLPGDSSRWIKEDGEGFARTAACDVFSALNSKTYNGRRRYCNDERTGFNTTAQEKCSEMCQSNSLCVGGCYGEFTRFCIGKWAC